MPKAIKICRVCGKEYEACHTNKSSNGTFRWQDVACSPECGAIYLAQIRASRNKAITEEEIITSNDDTPVEDVKQEVIDQHAHVKEETANEKFQSSYKRKNKKHRR